MTEKNIENEIAWSDHAISRWSERFSGIDRNLEFSTANRVSKKTRAKIKKLTPVSSLRYLSSEFKGRFCLMGRSKIVFVMDSYENKIVTVFHLYGYGNN